MPRKNKTKQDEFGEDVSENEHEGSGLSKEEKDRDPNIKLSAALEQLSEKRASTKLLGLEAMLTGLSNAYALDFLERQSQTVTEALLQIVRKGDAELVMKSIRVLCLVALTLGDEGIGAVGVFTNTWKVLEGLTRDPSKAAPVRIAAIEALALLCFIGAHEPEDEERCAAVFEELYRSLSWTDALANITAEALEAHGFLLSSAPLRVLCSASLNKYITTWTALLQHQSLEVRSMAGENLALICGARYKRAQDQEIALTEEDLPWLTSTIAKMEELVKDSSRRTAKSTRKKQRALFREILFTLKETEEPSEEMKVGKHKLKFTGWNKVKQLGAFRSLLGSGLPTHLVQNVVLRDLFAQELRVSLAEMEENGESTTDKPKKSAALYAEAHKLQFQAKAKGRSNKFAMQQGPVDD